ncbi:hypothetical protein CVT25_013291 [Psilocybe cyanescens]|uniref:UDP-glycosyltransferases domain-containing protein n=1 Tax=Psilocybe cyanescens TaxID=93625 RepID=A0A409VXD4_PSICY|nr:hypothetical protein CVT25_013291 [Psilocybe cyanescens]
MTPNSYENSNHFIFSAIPAWGHVRPFCILAARLVKEHETAIVTMILSPSLLSKAETEVAAEFGGEASESTRRRIRILATFHSTSQDIFSLFQPLAETYATAYQTLTDAKSISCAMTGTVFDAVPAPRAVILDPLALGQILATRAISGRSVPILSWYSGHVATIIRLFGPETLGGLDNLAAKIEAEATRRGVTAEEIGDSVLTHTEGKIIKIPGIPEMYDWEFFPQLPPFEAHASPIMKLQYQGMRESDGAFVVSAYAFEEESIKAFKSWQSDMNKEVYIVGPLLPPSSGSVAGSARGSSETEAFLEKAQATYGTNSVFYISFGTIFWPQNQDYLEEAIEALIEKKVPFILAYASPFAKLSDDLIARAELSGFALISKWVPQKYILNHPAIGWFVSHCGQNSVLEALGSGTPIICWPFDADQPVAAYHLSETLKVAIELIEVRTGEKGLKPLLRNGRKPKGTREAVGIEFRETLDACLGERGQELRRNAQDIKTLFAKSWGAGGISRQEFDAFLKKYGAGF